MDHNLRWLKWVCALIAAIVVAWIWIMFNGWLALVFGLVLFYVIILGGGFMADRFASEWPEGITTVGDLVRAAAPLDASQGSPGVRLLNQIKVLEEIRQMTAEQLGLPLDKVQPESDFFKDLRMD